MSKKPKDKAKIRAKIEGNKRYVRSFYTECALCGAKENLTFHHLDPKKKHKNLGQMYLCCKATLDKELAKGVILCQPCHCQVHRHMRYKHTLWLLKFRARVVWLNKVKKVIKDLWVNLVNFAIVKSLPRVNMHF